MGASQVPGAIRCLLGVLVALPLTGSALADAPNDKTAEFKRVDLAIPGAHGLVSLDYYVFDSANHRLWVPASNTGSVTIIDASTDQVTVITGFRTGQVDFMGKRPVMGPTSVTLGDGVAYVGNRGDSSVCVIDAHSLKLGECQPIGSAAQGLAAAPDALTYVAAVRELWVTRGVPPMNVPSVDRAITVYDASAPRELRPKEAIPLEASAEGFAVDNRRGRFYTSLEEHGETVGIDVHTHKITARFHSGCDEPHGLALDEARGILFVACMARVVSIDVAHNGEVLGSIDTGNGLDNIDYLPSGRMLWAAAAFDATLTVARVDEHGGFHKVAVWPTEKGARGVVVDSKGSAFVMDPYGGRILKFTPNSPWPTR
jgi:DNA-binding beta-propeller fold protein YncE